MRHFLKRASLHHAVAIVTMAWCFSLPIHADSGNFARRAVGAGDNHGQMFAVIDKTSATFSLYDATGRLVAASPALLGLARGDASVLGIGDRPIRDIAPHERTTPAGRFASEPGKNLQGQTVVWIDYDAAVSLHSLRPSDPIEKRRERLASPTPSDNRITYGCVNLPVEFYERWVLPTLGKKAGVIYVLPEEQPAKDHFVFLR